MEIGPYNIEQKLGGGGMGVVYRGVHRDTGEPAAVKTVKAGSGTAFDAIRREIHALARLHHPGIVRIVGHGLERGMPWYAMEIVPGTTLRELGARLHGFLEPTLDGAAQVEQAPPTEAMPTAVFARDRPGEASDAGTDPAEPAAAVARPAGADLSRVLTIARRLCAPLAFLHGEGIVHRDLKPDNVIVRPGDLPVIVDFGLVAGFGREGAGEELEVARGASGTVGYMAPEQARGELLDARADLYALGCILYELVTGLLPFHGEPIAVLYGHLHREPQPPSSHAPGLPPPLDALILRLLAKDPRARAGYAEDVAVELGRLGAANGSAAGAPRPRPYLYRPGLVGRGGPMERLQACADALERRRGSLVVVVGESGSGKTRLAMEAASRSRAALVLGGRGERGGAGNAPLGALRPLLCSIGDLCRTGGRTETERILGHRGRVLALYEPSLAALPGMEAHPEPAELDAESGQLRLFGYLCDVLRATTQAGSALCVLDDLQWADELTLGFLQHLVRSGALEMLSLELVATCRSEEMPEAVSDLLASAGVERIEVGKLAANEIASMVHDMLAIPEVPEDFVGFLARETSGNPFFVAEYLRAAAAQGILLRSAGVWQLAPSAAGTYGSMGLPRSLRDLMVRRLEQASPLACLVAGAVSILARATEPDVLAEVAAVPEADVLAALQELVGRQILEEASGELRFVHDRIAELAYAQMDEAPRREAHRRAAVALERRGAAPERVGDHWDRAGERARARALWLEGARRAVARYGLADAERLYAAYLSASDAPSAESIGARHELAERVLIVRGRPADAEAQHRAALAEARTLGDAVKEAESLRGVGNALEDRGMHAQAHAFLEEALAVAERSGDARVTAAALGRLGSFHLFQGERERAKGLLERSLAMTRNACDRAAEGITLGTMASLARETGQVDEAAALYEEACAVAVAAGDRKREAVSLGNLALLYYQQGNAKEAVPRWERALAIHREIGDRRFEGIVLGNMAMVPHSEGRLSEAEVLYSQALATDREVGNRRHEGIILGNLGVVRQTQGRLDEAAAFYEQALAVDREVGNRPFEAIALGNMGNLCTLRGQWDRAFELFSEELALHRAVKGRRWEGVALGSLGHVRTQQGRLVEARPLLEEGLAVVREVGNRPSEAVILGHLATLELFESGDPERAAPFVEGALALSADLGEQISVAIYTCRRAHLDLARGLDPAAVAASLAQVRAIVDSHKVEDHSEAARAIETLERALADAAAGTPLLLGHHAGDVPEAVRRRFSAAAGA